MAHLLSDIAQPMHTAETKKERSEHLKYEGKVDARCEVSPSNCIYRFRLVMRWMSPLRQLNRAANAIPL